MGSTAEFNKASEAAAYIRKCYRGSIPTVAVICGSGLGGFADSLDPGMCEIPNNKIPYMAQSTVAGHAGKVIIGSLCNGTISIICLAGRLHTYEGHPISDTVFPVRVFKLLGVKTLLVTNAAGGINPEFEAGDLMVISDHINIPGMAGMNPLAGPNDPEWGGSRFVAMNQAYSHRLRHKFFTIVDAEKIDRDVHEGVYCFLTGPNFETGAEVRLLAALGADAVGMSTVPEVVVAQHLGIEVLGLSLITNKAVFRRPRSGRQDPRDYGDEPDHDHVIAEGKKAANDVQKLITKFILSI